MGTQWIDTFSEFNPLDLTPILWLDADDASTISVGPGGVSQWRDKSGNAYHASQTSAGSQPSTGTLTLNGRNVIDFDGSGDYLESTIASNIGRNTSGITTYAVARYDNLAGGEDNVFRVTTSATSARLQTNLTSTAGLVRVAGRTLDTDSLGSANSTSLGASGSSGWLTQVGLYDIANTDLYQRINNVQNGVNTAYQTATTTSNTASSGYTVGASGGGGNHLDGAIAEILIFNQLHSTTTQTSVYEYLRRKWGV